MRTAGVWTWLPILAEPVSSTHQFWKDFRKAVKEANPEAVIIAEHYGDPSEWLKGDEWDTVMNYDAFMGAGILVSDRIGEAQR